MTTSNYGTMSGGIKTSPQNQTNGNTYTNSSSNMSNNASTTTTNSADFLQMNNGRMRSDSESSISSDMSSISMATNDMGRQIKRKDSEPYFWIMWHS